MISALIAVTIAGSQPVVRPELSPLAFLVGHCWQGRFETGEVDTHCFERVYDGQHVRDRHEVTGGRRPYRGETLYSWDGTANAVTFTYWNVLGGVSRGTLQAGADRLNFGDEIYRGADGQQMTLSTHWRMLGADSYESVTSSSQAPNMNRTVRFERIAPITMVENRAPDGSTTLIHETVVDAPVAEVWEAISTPEGWRSWAVPVAWASEPDILETSYDPQASPGDPSTIKQRILARVPERTLVIRTVKAPDGFPHFETFSRTTGVIELEAESGSTTRVRVVGAGYPDDDAGRQLLGFFREGNRISLDRLRRRFSIGPVDWSQETSRENHGSR